jgi:hypothetical protein
MSRMHADELEIDETLVRRLLSEQFPDFADRPLHRVEPEGTDNAIFRLGDELSVRLPRGDISDITDALRKSAMCRRGEGRRAAPFRSAQITQLFRDRADAREPPSGEHQGMPGVQLERVATSAL